MSKNSTWGKKEEGAIRKEFGKLCIILKVRMNSRPNPAPAEVSREGDQAACFKERGNGSLHLPAAHQELLEEVGGLCETCQELKYLYRSIGIVPCQKNTTAVQH